MPSDLTDYHAKRSFGRTPEPSGDDADASPDDTDTARFVIQKHDASTLHYDLRLEADGVLKSWAVPKGPSTDPREKRLAVPTEDHPLDYADFEGTIPEDQYGGGAVIVWDRGTYENRTTDDDDETIPVRRALDDGHLSVWLEGEKIRGGYALTRVATGDDERWLLVKMKDDAADARRNPTSTQSESVKTGRTLSEVAEAGES
ncbi:MAG: DNA ligase [Myxococcales bacterium]|nr:DNA ligase [Myxococcales bacterium]